MNDIYLYEDVPVLKNKFGIKDEKTLDLVEAEQSRASMMLLYEHGFHDFSNRGVKKIHRTLFEDVYEWAGNYRVINIIKREPVLAGQSVWYCIVAGEEQPVKKKLVLVFDDFERCKIGVIDLLGIINTYVEDKRIKTIVIASEDNIEDEENYKTFKEKVVERTVKLDMEYRRIQQEMIEDYKTETSEYKEFLKKESPKLFQVFEESGSRNLRTFKSCLIDFERVYGLWHSLKLPTDGMGEAL